MIIPSVDIPLAPDKCMHDDFEDAARNFHLPPPLVESCTAETNICRGFHCNFTGSGETYSTCITIEPCNETLQITITDSLEQVQYDEVFSNNRSVVLHPRVGPDFTLMVHMHQYNYSMDAEVSAGSCVEIAAIQQKVVTSFFVFLFLCKQKVVRKLIYIICCG